MKMKRFLSLLMTFCMVLTLLPVGASAATEKYVEFTVDSLGLEAQKYTAGTTTVSGVAVEWVQLGNYGNGIQMRDKADKGTSMLWNTSAMGAGITKIELTYSATQEVKYANADAVIFNFGYSAQGASYSTKLSTTADVKTYTITPNADTYTYFYMEHDLAYTFYWDSIKVYYKESEPGDHVSAPELVDGYYEIFTADQLYWFAEKVNGGDTAINGKLMADIAVNENVLKEDGTLNGDGSGLRSWEPIVDYMGTFDGNGKTISGLYISDSDADTVDHIGLFSSVGADGVVRNLTIDDSYMSGDNSGDDLAGVVAVHNAGTIENCGNRGTVTNYYSGGIVYKNEGTISRCVNSGNIHGYYAGGIAANNQGTISNCYNIGKVGSGDWVGGIVGYNAGAVANCYNAVSIVGESAGGVAGYTRSGGSVSNSYYLSGTAPYAGGGTVKTAQEFASGVVTYLLQGSQTEEIWGQTIGVDDYPILGGAEVLYEDGVYFNNTIPELVDGYYEIYTAGQLYWFAAQVNGGSTSINGKLMADIVVNENVLKADGTLNGDGSNFRVWTPIGNSNNKFEGTFDGNGKTVSGLYFNDASKSYVGLIGAMMVGKVENVGVVDSYLLGYNNVGGVVGYNYFEGTVRHCYNTGFVSGNGSVGGVVGDNNADCFVSYCYNTGFVSGSSFVGGVVGRNKYDSYGIGWSPYVENCYNTGNVSGTSSVGGVVGLNSNAYSFDSEEYIKNCYNSGSVSGSSSVGGVVGSTTHADTNNCYNTGIVSGSIHVGGVVGYNDEGIVTKSYNTGTVSASGNDIGGVVGKDYYGTINNCYNAGNVNGNTNIGGIVGSKEGQTVQNCHNVGTVSGTTNVAAVVGAAFSCTVSNCYYISGCCNAAGSGILKSVAQFASGEVAYLLQGDQTEQIWGQTIGTDAYPVLGGEIVFWDGDYYNCTHSWSEATCFAPKTCMVCGTTTGSALGHSYENGFCVYCDVYEPAVLNGDVYEISNAGQLYWFAAKVNGGETAINGKLMADIAVNENVLKEDGTLNGDGSNFRVWTPIGNSSERYAGTFDGNGKTVSGLYFNDTSKSHVGLFGDVGSGGVVKNVGVVDCYFRCDDFVGGVVGDNYGGTVSNCYNTGSVAASSNSYVGGVVGSNFDGTVSNCYNTGSVIASGSDPSVGDMMVIGPSVGGVVGSNIDGTVSNCYNTGSVIASGSDPSVGEMMVIGPSVGGVVGHNDGTVSNSYNTGSISGSYFSVGGVVGFNYCTVSDCYNTGSVIGSDEVGGVTGWNAGTVRNSYSVGVVCGSHTVGGVVGGISDRGTVSDCYNTGSISGSNDIGGVVGYNYQGTVDNCYYLNDCVSADNGYGSAMTAQRFASGEVAYLLQGDQTEDVWGQAIGTDAYPVLGGVKVYKNQTGGCNADTYTYEYSNTQATAVVTHNWTDATCTKPSTCTHCNVTSGDPLGHDWKAATCADPKTCNRCGLAEGNALGHKWSDATCTTAKTCSVCGTTSGKPLGHKWSDATCTTAKTCSVCGTTSGKPLDHKWEWITTVEPTCTESGVYAEVCEFCGAVSESTELPARGHYYHHEVTAQPTCTEYGIVTHTCTVCGDTYSDSRMVNLDEVFMYALREFDAGEWDAWPIVSELWTVLNPEHSYNCNINNCFKYLSAEEYEAWIDRYIDADDDMLSKIREYGYDPDTNTYMLYHVYMGGYIYGRAYMGYVDNGGTYTVFFEDREYETLPEEAQYIIDGYLEAEEDLPDTITYKGKVYEHIGCAEYVYTVSYKGTGNKYDVEYDGNTVRILSWGTYGPEDKPAEFDHGKYPNLEPIGHNYQAVVTAPGCLSDGYTTHTCLNCGDSYTTDFVLGTGHSWINATCTEPMTCAVCKVTVGNALGHNWKDGSCIEPKTCTTCGIMQEMGNHNYQAVVTAPGCMSDGYTTYTCSLCGHSYRDDYILATGHSWVSASCTEPMHCVNCGVTVGTELGHNYVDSVCTICGHQLPAVGVTVTGTVTSYLTDGDVTVELLRGGEVVHSIVVHGKTVEYNFESVMAGTYTLRVSKENHVTREYEVTVGEENVNLDVKICPKGDVTGDGAVNIKDFQRLLRHINKTNPLEDYELLCGDVTGDGTCNIKDFQRLLRHINKTNPLF